MLSRSQNSESIPIAFDTDEKLPDSQKLIFFHSEMENSNEHIIAKDQFQPWFWGDTISYICAKRGAGKSTYCNEYITSYVKATDGRVFLVSRFESDPSLQLPERGLQLSIDELMGLEMSDLENSLIVFDDIHNVNYSKKETSFLESFILDLIENSRHFSLSALITSHLITKYAKTRAILNECSSLVIFPQYSNKHQIDYALKQYFGFDNQQIKQIYQLKQSRWVQIQTTIPKFILTQHEIFIYE